MKKIKKNLSIILLVGIFILACILRFYNLSGVPTGFHIDEAIIADNANFILQTGRDTNNHYLPLQTEVFGDYNPTGYAYLAILPIKILGLTIFATRSVGALLGVLTVVAVFFLVYAVFERKNLSLLTAFLMAFSPWHIVLSRSSEETIASLLFIVAGFASVIWGIRKQKIPYLLVGFILLLISYFMYFTPRLFVPLLFLFLFLPWKYWYQNRSALFTKLFFACFMALAIISFVLVFGFQGGASRFNQVSIFGFPETRLVMEEQIREDGVLHSGLLVTRFFHNKIAAYGRTFVGNYLTYFSSDFLFIKGGYPIWFNVPQMGLVYLVELPFIIYGIFRFFVDKKKWSYVLIAWLIVAPVGGALTIDDSPNVRRALIMVPIIEMLAAYGFLAFFKMKFNKFKTIIAGVVIVMLAYNSFYFLHEYFSHSKIHRNWYRNEGAADMFSYVKKSYSSVDNVILTKADGAIYPLVLFYMNYTPSDYLAQGLSKDRDYTGFGKFFFVPQACPYKDRDSRFPKGQNMYVGQGECEGGNKNDIIVNRRDNTKAFRISYD